LLVCYGEQCFLHIFGRKWSTNICLLSALHQVLSAPDLFSVLLSQGTFVALYHDLNNFAQFPLLSLLGHLSTTSQKSLPTSQLALKTRYCTHRARGICWFAMENNAFFLGENGLQYMSAVRRKTSTVPRRTHLVFCSPRGPW